MNGSKEEKNGLLIDYQEEVGRMKGQFDEMVDYVVH
jgi:hypothetical protein